MGDKCNKIDEESVSLNTPKVDLLDRVGLRRQSIRPCCMSAFLVWAYWYYSRTESAFKMPAPHT